MSLIDIIFNPAVSGLIGSGALFVFAGLLMKKFPPKKINSLYGYRTPSSMKSQERWDFAQIYGAKQLMKTGAAMCLFSLIVLTIHRFFPLNESLSTGILIFVLLFATILLLLNVESAIKKRFGD
ncbi:MAG TPA: SdpI family protein [Flavobacteriaceae bacterium]|nr:SdpI family protein [Flavobacteriaceae bacterium]